MVKSFKQYLDEEILNSIFDNYEHTQSVIDEAYYLTPAKPQPWGAIKLSSGSKKETTLEAAKLIYAKAREIVENALPYFNREMKKYAQHGKFISNIKSEQSFIDKVVNRNKPADKIRDMLRGAILLETKEDVDVQVDIMRRRLKIVDYEYKGEGTSEFGYYGSHHLDILLEPHGVIAEVQVMHRKLWHYKEPAHDIYKKYGSGTNTSISADIRKRDLAYSRELFSRGNN